MLVLAENKVFLHVKQSESKFDKSYFTQTIPGQVPVKKFWFHHFLVLQLYFPKEISGKFYPDFSSLVTFLGTTPTFLKKIVEFPNA